jgi:hypothetical protein
MKMLMKSCRDCYYGIAVSLGWGYVSCMKYNDYYKPEKANDCKFYKSTSAKWTLTWREMVKDFKGKLMRKFYT